MIGIFLMPLCLSGQDILLPSSLPSEYIFSLGPNGSPTLITQNKVFTLKNKWTFTSLERDTIKLGSNLIKSLGPFNNENFILFNNSEETKLVLCGGGHVLSLKGNFLSRIDDSVIQRNQHKASTFFYKGRLYMYGGYGFWTFKNYITYLDKQTGQWEIVLPKSKYIPPGRWRAIAHSFNDKMYILGGRYNPSESSQKDVPLNDHFYFDLKTQEFISLGKINPKLPISSYVVSNTRINGKKAYFQNDRANLFDFQKDTLKSYYKKGLFNNINTKKPVFEFNDTLFFIKKTSQSEFLSKFPLNVLNKLTPELYQISYKKPIPFQLFLTIFFVLLACWMAYKLFVFKDFLKGLVLYDENRIYFEEKSALLSPEQISVIETLHLHGQLTSLELNKIITSKKFVKSHFTALRIQFLKEINRIYKNVTGTKLNLIYEVKDPNDKRYKVYKITQQISPKESFINFLFKI
tara:strand:- start:26109 stop:27494 length:1386 start_codon:yes stop_codon:yes gene_type:complete